MFSRHAGSSACTGASSSRRASSSNGRVDDISPPQGLIPTKIEDRDVSVRDIVERGYYLGSNVSYNIGQIVQSGYVTQDDD